VVGGQGEEMNEGIVFFLTVNEGIVQLTQWACLAGSVRLFFFFFFGASPIGLVPLTSLAV
jgi:hypothetical protein